MLFGGFPGPKTGGGGRLQNLGDTEIKNVRLEVDVSGLPDFIQVAGCTVPSLLKPFEFADVTCNLNISQPYARVNFYLAIYADEVRRPAIMQVSVYVQDYEASEPPCRRSRLRPLAGSVSSAPTTPNTRVVWGPTNCCGIVLNADPPCL